MRSVARTAIAIVTLLTTAVVCSGQQTMPNYGKFGGPSPFAGGDAPVEPVAEGPTEAQGVWVADDDDGVAEYETYDDDGFTTIPQPPAQLGAGEFAIDESMGSAEGATCDCDECCAAAGVNPRKMRRQCRKICRRRCRGGLCGPLWCSDLWNEVHAHRRIYVQADYLSFWTKGNALPPLVTTSPLGTPQSQAGRLPVSATTAILFGGNRVDQGQRNGGRINVGYWLIDGEFLGIEGQYFALQQGSTGFDAVSNFSSNPNSQILARPFFNVDPNLAMPEQDALIVAFPDGFNLGAFTGILDGAINIRTTSNLQSAGALMRRLIWIDFTMQRRLDLLLGYRFFRIGDSVTINDQSDFIGTSDPVNISFVSQDLFSSRNLFNGGEIGLKWQSYHGRLSLELIGKCAFGNNHQETYINGFTVRTVDGQAPVEFEGGLLAQPTNIGTHRRNVFAVLPEANANLRFDITCNLRATLGYTFIYINRVQRSGDAINLTVNGSQIDGGTLVGPPEPAFRPDDTAFWAHGVSAGVEYRW